MYRASCHSQICRPSERVSFGSMCSKIRQLLLITIGYEEESVDMHSNRMHKWFKKCWMRQTRGCIGNPSSRKKEREEETNESRAIKAISSSRSPSRDRKLSRLSKVCSICTYYGNSLPLYHHLSFSLSLMEHREKCL